MNRSSRGFGLIELLIALALSLVVVLGVAQIFIAAKNTMSARTPLPPCRKMRVSC
jgi:prepilin-type N-terminal cleavage/methylation domain